MRHAERSYSEVPITHLRVTEIVASKTTSSILRWADHDSNEKHCSGQPRLHIVLDRLESGGTLCPLGSGRSVR